MTRAVAARSWGVGTAILGAAAMLAPGAVAGLVSSGASSPSPAIVRVLGARQLLQGVAVIVRPRRALVLAGSIVDALHTASMLAVAQWWPRYRRPALGSAAVAAASGVAGGLISRRSVT